MSTSISGNIRLTYGNHQHNETYSAETAAPTFSNTGHDYSAGADRATYHANVGTALSAGSIDSAEGLLLISNNNTVGKLCVSLDAGTSWDIKIPAGLANLVSVGPDHPVHIKTDIADRTNQSVSSVTTTGGFVFAAAIPEAGTYVMTANASPDNTTSGPAFIMKTEVNSTTNGKVYELDGSTLKDLATGPVYTGATHVNLANVADYRFTLTEA
jgi:hypothetical protein